MKVYREAHWYLSPAHDSFFLTVAGEYESTARPDINLQLDIHHINSLLECLKKEGYFKPEMPWDRTEDVKIIHRLIDLIEKR